MRTFYFAKDQILRFKCWDYNEEAKRGRYLLLPVRSLEKLEPGLFWRSLYDGIEFEEGLTVRDLFLNLEPWAEQMTQISEMDFLAFCNECRKPAEPDKDLDHVLIRPFARIAAVPEYERFDGASEHERFDSGDLSWFKNRRAVTTDRLQMELGWDAATVLKEPKYDPDADHTYTEVSTDMMSLSEWGHCPVKLSEEMVLEDGSTWAHRMGHLSSPEPLLNEKNPLVTASYHKEKLSGLSVKIEMEPNFMETLVRGTFWNWGFFYSPVQRDEAFDKVMKSVKNLKEELSQGKDYSEREESPSDKEEQEDAPLDDDHIEMRRKLFQKVVEADPDVIIKPYEDTERFAERVRGTAKTWMLPFCDDDQKSH